MSTTTAAAADITVAFEREEVVVAGQAVRHAEHWVHDSHAAPPPAREETPSRDRRRHYAMFCFEEPDSPVGQSVVSLARAVAKFETPVHIFSRSKFPIETPGVHEHIVGGDTEETLLTQVQDFMRRACNEFLREFRAETPVTVIGFEWSSIPAVSLLRAIRNVGFVLSLHSLERQRSNVVEGVGRYIEETELAGLREARLVLCHDQATADVAARCVPDCANRIETIGRADMLHDFQFDLDPGEVKGRFQVGPTDPTILFVGDLSENYGPDLLMKAVPKVLRNYKQARCIFVGDGDLLWPLRVHSRYLLLDYAVRLVGHMEGRALRELVYAADIVVVPSRKATPWWPIEAAWAANRPVVTTPEAADGLVIADLNAAVVVPDEACIAAGIERVLGDPAFARAIASEGRAKLEERFSIGNIATRIQEATGAPQALEPDLVSAEA